MAVRMATLATRLCVVMALFILTLTLALLCMAIPMLFRDRTLTSPLWAPVLSLLDLVPEQLQARVTLLALRRSRPRSMPLLPLVH